MARSLNGNLRGAAARTERNDEIEHARRVYHNARVAIYSDTKARLINELQALDPDGWMKWYDSEEMPAWGWLDQIACLEKHIAELKVPRP
jgi:hypothetical protein